MKFEIFIDFLGIIPQPGAVLVQQGPPQDYPGAPVPGPQPVPGQVPHIGGKYSAFSEYGQIFIGNILKLPPSYHIVTIRPVFV